MSSNNEASRVESAIFSSKVFLFLSSEFKIPEEITTSNFFLKGFVKMSLVKKVILFFCSFRINILHWWLLRRKAGGVSEPVIFLI